MDEAIDKIAGNRQEDQLLVQSFQQGKEKDASFEKLVLKYRNRIFNLCYRMLGIYDEADDCAQEVFLKVYLSLGNFRGESSFSTWVYRIAMNACKNKLVTAEYRHRKRTLRLDDPLPTADGEVRIEIKDESSSPALELEKKEKDSLIQGAIEALPEDQRQMVVLRDVEGLSYEEIVRVSGFTMGTVKSKLSRARAALSEKLRRMR
jgi:RNA polymerase sigma-70 factor (ECF subfamily)